MTESTKKSSIESKEWTRRDVVQTTAMASLSAWLPAAASARPPARQDEESAEWSNWSGAVNWTPARVERPETVDELVAQVRQAAREGLRIRLAGTGHSFVPLLSTDGITTLLTKMRGVKSVNPEKRLATVYGGTKLHELHAPLLEEGLAMTNLPDIDRQSIAGAISTATHGTGPSLGSLSSQVVGIGLVDGRGRVVRVSAKERPELFRAAKISLGALGVIFEVTLQLDPAFRLHEQTRIVSYDEAVERVPQEIDKHRHFEFFWVSDRDACLFKSLDPTDRTDDVERYDDDTRLTGERVGWSGDIFPSLRNTRFNETEYAVPIDRGLDCWAELRELMRGRHKDITWPLEYRTVAREDAMLAPSFDGPVVTISAHQAAGLEYQPFFSDLEAVFQNHGGRPHWGKMHSLGAKELREIYPEFDAFVSARRTLDPEGRYLNPYLERVLGVSA